ncbi:hypothetical protein FRC03_012231 [Tulasnella sp. 419]|nr:hypothetical protein FRC03_012231 [Tulasnella sp. 419]
MTDVVPRRNSNAALLRRPSSRASNFGDTRSPPPSASAVAAAFASQPLASPLSSKASKRTSSYDTLQQIVNSGPTESHLPLPIGVRSPGPSSTPQESIQEGVPLDVINRPYTPTRTLSRIPVSSVGNARALTEDTSQRSLSPLPALNPDGLDLSTPLPSSSTLQVLPASQNPNRRSLGAGGTSKVLSDLQSAAIQARSQLENTRSQLRLSQRSVAQLTRQVEDLKDGRERLRLENETLNNVVSRKERLLQEILERARKAEAEVITLKSQVKTEVQNNKRNANTVSEAVAQSQKSQREYTTLRDSITGLAQGWKQEVKDLREEMKKKDEQWKAECEELAVKYKALVKLVQATKSDNTKFESVKAETNAANAKFEEYMKSQLQSLSAAIEKSSQDSDEAGKTAAAIASDLAFLRRLMRSSGAVMIDPDSVNDTASS